MASNYGLTGSGFNLPPMDDLVEETKKTFKSAFGEDFNTESNSVADKMIQIFNEREYQLWLLMGAVYYSQTMQGAEGIFLDDLFGKQGIYRLGKTKSTGSVIMTLDDTVPYNTVYSVGTYIIDTDYQLSADVQVAGNIIAQKILSTDLKPGGYRFQIQNIADQSVKVLNLTLLSTSGTALSTFYGQIKDFIVDNTIESNRDRIIIDSTEGALYIGYDSNKKIIGLSSRVDFRTSPLIGEKTIVMDAKAIQAGVLSRDAHSVRTISPTPEGFVDMDNLSDFIAGADVESDNEYRIRATISMNDGRATRPAIISALLNRVEGIEKVRIFNNNTDKTNGLGIPPYRFMVVCYGGCTAEISRVLYDFIAMSNNTYGSTFYDITTEDDQVERIWHTKAVARNLEVRVRYRGRPLSVTEETAITDALVTSINGTMIAGTLYNVRLVGTVMSSTSPDRFTQVYVDIKNKGAPDDDYLNSDISADPTQVFIVEPEDITFSQIV